VTIACPAARGDDLGDDRVGRVRHDVGDGDRRAFRREEERGRATDARSASRDDGDLVRESRHGGARYAETPEAVRDRAG
jgi:hypothetical protein